MDLKRSDTSQDTITIHTNSIYEGLRACAGNCICNTYVFGYRDLAGYIGCGSPVLNTCYCNSNIVPEASSWVSSCVSVNCDEDADVSAAFGAYENYCSGAGYPLVDNIAVTTAETITSGTVTEPTTFVVTVANTAAPTVTATSSDGNVLGQSSYATSATAFTSSQRPISQSTTTPSDSGNSSQSNAGAIAGGVVGGVVAIGIVAIIITVLILRERRRNRVIQPPASPAWGQQTAPFQPPLVAGARAIPKTSATTQAAPAYTMEDAIQRDPELDGVARMGPELDGWGGHMPRPPFQEMHG